MLRWWVSIDSVWAASAGRRHALNPGPDEVETQHRDEKRAIQKKIETPLGRLLLQGTIRDGQTVLVDAGNETGDLTFRPETVAAARS